MTAYVSMSTSDPSYKNFARTYLLETNLRALRGHNFVYCFWPKRYNYLEQFSCTQSLVFCVCARWSKRSLARRVRRRRQRQRPSGYLRCPLGPLLLAFGNIAQISFGHTFKVTYLIHPALVRLVSLSPAILPLSRRPYRWQTHCHCFGTV